MLWLTNLRRHRAYNHCVTLLYVTVTMAPLLEDLDLSLVEKLNAIAPVYFSSDYMDVSKELKSFIDSTSALSDKLREKNCTVAYMEHLCLLDRRFAEAVFADGIISSTISHLKSPDASNLYYLGGRKKRVEIGSGATPAQEDAGPTAVAQKDFGRALLRLVNLFFENRYELYEKRVDFLKNLFSFFEKDSAVLNRYKTEFMHHFLRLQTEMESFFKQFPKVPPRVGDFGFYRHELKKLSKELWTYRNGKVAVVFASAESSVTAGPELANVATSLDSDAPSSPPPKRARLIAESATNTPGASNIPGDGGAVPMTASTLGDEEAVPMTALQPLSSDDLSVPESTFRDLSAP
jgi:hypothetical protein